MPDQDLCPRQDDLHTSALVTKFKSKFLSLFEEFQNKQSEVRKIKAEKLILHGKVCKINLILDGLSEIRISVKLINQSQKRIPRCYDRTCDPQDTDLMQRYLPISCLHERLYLIFRQSNLFLEKLKILPRTDIRQKSMKQRQKLLSPTFLMRLFL